MKLIVTLLSLLGTLPLGIPSLHAANAKPPSIIWILLDQVSADSFGCYGHPFSQTPNFDRIATQGVRFTNACVVGMPCVPSRVSYNAGLYPHQTGVFGNFGAMRETDGNLPRLLRKGGVQECILISKDHFGTPPDKVGYTKHIKPSSNDDYESKEPVVKNRAGAIYSAHSAKRPEEMYSGRCVSEAIAEYDRLTAAQSPFFFCLSINRPHPNTVVSSPFYEMYEKDVPLPVPNLEELKDKPDSLRKAFRAAMASMSPQELQRAIRSHYASLSEVDYNVGRLLDHIKSRWEAGEVIVAVSADHGSFLGRYWRLEKGYGYRATVCVPFIISQPGRLKPGKVDCVVESIDFLPTLLDLSHTSADLPLPGVSLVPVMDGKVTTVKEAAYNEDGDRKTVRTAEWHFSLHPKGANPTVNRELYDLINDPKEKKNLAGDPAFATQCSKLEQMIIARLGTGEDSAKKSDREKRRKATAPDEN